MMSKAKCLMNFVDVPVIGDVSYLFLFGGERFRTDIRTINNLSIYNPVLL